jgi:hypothetical protein
MITNTWVTGGSGVVGVVLGVVGMWTGAGAELLPPPGAVTVCAAMVWVTTVGPELPPPLDEPPDEAELSTGAATLVAGVGPLGCDTARSSGPPEVSASELAPEPTTTPKASIDITATADALGGSEARNAAAPERSRRAATRSPSPVDPDTPSAGRATRPEMSSATAGGRGARRAPHLMQ